TARRRRRAPGDERRNRRCDGMGRHGRRRPRHPDQSLGHDGQRSMMTIPNGHLDLREHWNGLARGELRAEYSLPAQRYWWPPRAACPRTQSLDYEWRPVPPTAHLFTWTVVADSNLPEFRGRTPYAVGVLAF